MADGQDGRQNRTIESYWVPNAPQMELAGEPDSSHKRGHIEDRGTSGHSGVALGALHEQKGEASQFRGPCLECRPRAQRQPGREANPWERFSAKLEDPKIARALAKMLARKGAPRRSKMTEKLMAARRPDDDDNTQEVALPTDLRSCVQSATGLAIFLSPGWLWRFGALSTLPEAVERLDLTAQSGGAMIALAAFQEAGAALKAVKALDGFDWRFRSGTETPRSQKLIEARRVADTFVFRWLIMHEVHECFSAKIVHDEEAAGSSQKSCKSLSGTESKDPLRLPSPVGGSSAPEASGSVQAPEDPKEPEAGSPSPPAKPRRTARVKLQQTGRRLRWEKSSSEAEAEDQPWDWSALQLQMLFTPFGGLALVRLEELAQHAAAAVRSHAEHVLGPREKELLAKAAEVCDLLYLFKSDKCFMLPQEAERLRKEAEEEAARQRKAAAAEAERLRQAAMFASRRVIWEAANADFAAAVLAEAQPADAERCKRLQAAAESLRDASLSKQRRRMFVALVEAAGWLRTMHTTCKIVQAGDDEAIVSVVEAERKRQATMATELEHEAMCTADAESKAWQQYLLHAEHQYLEMLRQAEAAETLAAAPLLRCPKLIARVDVLSRHGLIRNVAAPSRRRRRERESQAAEGRAMKKADDESRRVEAATFLAEEEAREEFESAPENIGDRWRRSGRVAKRAVMSSAYARAELMERAEAEFFRRQEEERRRQAEEERKQKLVLEWRRLKDDAAKKRKRETEEAAAELQRFEQANRTEEEDLRKEEEAERPILLHVRFEKKATEFWLVFAACEAWLERSLCELMWGFAKSCDDCGQERAEKKRKEQEEKLRDERRAEARTFHPQQAARLLQAKEQDFAVELTEIARMQAELLKRRQEEAQKKCQQKQEEEKRGRGAEADGIQGKENTSKAKPKFESQPKAEKKMLQDLSREHSNERRRTAKTTEIKGRIDETAFLARIPFDDLPPIVSFLPKPAHVARLHRRVAYTAVEALLARLLYPSPALTAAVEHVSPPAHRFWVSLALQAQASQLKSPLLRAPASRPAFPVDTELAHLAAKAAASDARRAARQALP
ncbi:hypothetical protein AK812_SmicGene25015 [Symbiodinium microadriaticum]|uniref:Uncharacterized protein n=1 Tax=Symbiodinium microadriaticum TaxID=2951 RepID=A0A1Q9DD55_SYMMI|nr:hypothetical protein AK812_SmicGene25015 [Symbiodinium microadriaticum]